MSCLLGSSWSRGDGGRPWGRTCQRTGLGECARSLLRVRRGEVVRWLHVYSTMEEVQLRVKDHRPHAF